MNLDQFYSQLNNQQPLYAPSSAREYLRGQCVQLVSVFVDQVWHVPVIWADAYNWYGGGALLEYYRRIPNNPNNPNQIPPRGALVVFSKSLPGSGGYGHIDICWEAKPGSNSWVGFDANWGGKQAHLVTHNWQYVVGWLVPINGSPTGDNTALTPAAPAQGGDEVIKDYDQAVKMYQMLRPNSSGTQEEVDATAGKRTYEEFVNSAQNEVSARNANLANQASALSTLQANINTLNQTVTDLRIATDTDAIKDADVAKQLSTALDKLGEQTAQLSTDHDTIKDLQAQLSMYTSNPSVQAVVKADSIAKNQSWFVRMVAALLRRK